MPTVAFSVRHASDFLSFTCGVAAEAGRSFARDSAAVQGLITQR